MCDQHFKQKFLILMIEIPLENRRRALPTTAGMLIVGLKPTVLRDQIWSMLDAGFEVATIK